MSTNLNIGDFILSKDRNGSFFTPFLFETTREYPEEISALNRLLECLKEKRSIKVVDFDPDEFINFFNNKKLGRVFIIILTRPPFCEIKSDLVKGANDDELLYEIWLEVNKSQNGFCKVSQLQNDVFHIVKRKLANRSLVLDHILDLNSLYQDHTNQQVFFFRLAGVSAEELLISYNKTFFRIFLRNSNRIDFLIDNKRVSGDFYKKIFLKSRGLLVDYTLMGEKLLITVTGPKDLIGRHVLYSKALSRLFFEIIKLTLQHNYETRITLFIDFLNRKRIIRIPIVTEKVLLQLKHEKGGDYTKETAIFDSNVEKNFYEAFRQFSSRWEIQREPEVLFLGDTVIIPDFTIQWRDVKIYVEIVGFWTAKYLNKKFAKLRKLSRTNTNFVVLIDSKLEMDSTGLPTFTYKGIKYPLQEIINFLDTNYYKEAFEVHKSKKMSEITQKSSLDDIILRKKVIRNDELLTMLEITELRELDAFLFDENFLSHLKGLEFIVVPQFGLVNKDYFGNLKESISHKLEKSFDNERIGTKGIDYENFRREFDIDEKLLRKVVELSGYDIIWESLVKCCIKKKKT